MFGCSDIKTIAAIMEKAMYRKIRIFKFLIRLFFKKLNDFRVLYIKQNQRFALSILCKNYLKTQISQDI